MFETVSQIKAANRAAGQHWFSPSTTAFFKSRVESGVINGRYFVTSECGPDQVRAFTIREADADGSINTVGEFQGYSTAKQAVDAAYALADQAELVIA